MPNGENTDENTDEGAVQAEPYVPDKDRGGNTVEIGNEQGYIGHVPDELPQRSIDQPQVQPVHPSDSVEAKRRAEAAVGAAESDTSTGGAPGNMTGEQLVSEVIENVDPQTGEQTNVGAPEAQQASQEMQTPAEGNFDNAITREDVGGTPAPQE